MIICGTYMFEFSVGKDMKKKSLQVAIAGLTRLNFRITRHVGLKASASCQREFKSCSEKLRSCFGEKARSCKRAGK